MKRFLLIDTATHVCSVALSEGSEIKALREAEDEKYIHSEKLHVFIQEVLEETGWDKKSIDAVVISKGPGSYTGLRIGVSAAKGLCYGWGVPLISMDTLQVLTFAALEKAREADLPVGATDKFCAMLDARRMEVYQAIYDGHGKELSKAKATVVEDGVFAEENEGSFYYFGDGAEKCQEVFANEAHFQFLPDVKASTRFMVATALEKWEQQEFEDVAYFEPFYLKDFIAGKPRKYF